jgi:DNA-binding NtrC family response regulator
VLGIVRGHGGAVRVRSELGRGTTFEIALPLASPALSRDAQPLAAQASSAGGNAAATVLVVDDEPAVRAMTRNVLERAGFTVVAVSGGREALEVVASRRAELTLVLVDRAMPDLGGEEVARRLAKTHPDLPLVMISGFGEQDEVEALIGCRLAGFVHKPFEVDELVAVAMRVLGQSGEIHKAG